MQITKYPSGKIGIRQEWSDLEIFNDVLTEGAPLGDVASWLMSAYFRELYSDSGTTFGEIVGGFLDPYGQYAGFTFRDIDSGDEFEVMVKHQHDSYRPIPPIQDLYNQAQALVQGENELSETTYRQLLDFTKLVASQLRPYAKNAEEG